MDNGADDIHAEWLADNGPILGISNEARLKEFVAAVDFDMTEDEKAYLKASYCGRCFCLCAIRAKAAQGSNLDRAPS